MLHHAERYKQVLEQHLLPSRWPLFQGSPCIFQQDKVGFIVEGSEGWTDLPALSTTENIRSTTKCWMWQRPSSTVEQLDSYIRQEWDNTPLQKASSWSPQFPDVYRLLLKEEGMLYSGIWSFDLFSMFYCEWYIYIYIYPSQVRSLTQASCTMDFSL